VRSFELQVKADQRIGAPRVSAYMASALSSLVDGLERTPAEPVLARMALPETERHQVIEAFNATRTQYSEHELIHRLFEDQVGRTPTAIALVYEGQTVTYADLNGRANRLARFLREKNVGPETCVGICVERSVELVVGLLGILKAGAAYVPMDPSYPEQRQQYLLRSAAPRVVLTQAHLKKGRFAVAATVIALDGDWSEIAQRDAANLDPREVNVRPRNLAYVIYTSGSTGEPKGAMNEHRAVVNRLLWMQEHYRLTSEDRILQKTPFSFDVSVWEFFWTLISGARLVIARPGGHQDPLYLQGLIEREGVTRLHFVPSMLQVFLEQVRPESCASLRHIVCSGEELSPLLNDRCLASLPQARLSNLYGPTEAAVDVTAWECTMTPEGGRVPLGKPISNVQMYVLNRQRQPLPVGVAGEIHIGGVGVGRGYLNRPDLTAERFVPDPFSGDPGARLYRTGDLGHWRANGVLEYLGRNDHQVKIRGLRIELGEIESKLLQHDQVKETVVVARTDETGEKTLVAYVVPKDARSPSCESITNALTAYLQGILPDYMVPGAMVVLERLPLSPNGKLDRRALPAPQVALARRYEAPEGATEILLAEIWRKLLRVSRIGRRDNFFELGGHSLHGVRVIAKVAENYGVELPAVALFRHPTLEALARYVEKLRAESTEVEEFGH
jgi:amino acid adenylation domain-containing protein